MTVYKDANLASDYQRILSRLREAKARLQREGMLFALCGLTGADIENICTYTKDANATAVRALLATYNDENSTLQQAIGHAADAIGQKLSDLEA